MLAVTEAADFNADVDAAAMRRNASGVRNQRSQRFVSHLQLNMSVADMHQPARAGTFGSGDSRTFTLCGEERNFTGEHFWARGYAVSTVGFELE
jgi:hypothetical protein